MMTSEKMTVDGLSPGRGECCNGVCGCGLSEKGNRYRGAPGSINNCQCEPEEEACTNPVVSDILDGTSVCQSTILFF